MKINKIILLILFLMKLNCHFKYCSNRSDDINKTRTCSRSLLDVIHAKGYNVAQKKVLPMFTFINYSCCKYTDQYKFLKENETKNKGNTNVKFETLLKFYEDLLDNLDTLNNILITIKEKKYLDIECKAVLNSALLFDFSKIKDKLFKLIKDLVDFFEVSNKGLFGAICNINTQQHFNFADRNIRINYNFCRTLLERALPVWRYLYKLLYDYIKLIKKLSKYCEVFIVINMDDYKNKEFKDDFKDDEIFLNLINDGKVSVTQKFKDNIFKCMENVDKKIWKKYCSVICNKYKINHWQAIFFGRLSFYKRFNSYLLKKLNQWKGSNKEVYYINLETKLERIAKKYKSNKNMLNKILKNYNKIKIISTDKKKERYLESKMHINVWKVKLHIKGVDFYRIGYSSKFSGVSLIRKDEFNKVKSVEKIYTSKSYFHSYYKKYLSKNCMKNLKYYNISYFKEYNNVFLNMEKKNCEEYDKEKINGVLYNNFQNGKKYLNFLNYGMYLKYREFKDFNKLSQQIEESRLDKNVQNYLIKHKSELYKKYLLYEKLKNCMKRYKYSLFKNKFRAKTWADELRYVPNKKTLFKKISHYDLYKDYLFIYNNKTNKNLPWAKALKRNVRNQIKNDYNYINTNPKLKNYVSKFYYLKFSRYKKLNKVTGLHECSRYIKYEKYRFYYIFKDVYDKNKDFVYNFDSKTVKEGKLLYEYQQSLKFDFFSKLKNKDKFSLGFYYEDYLNSYFMDGKEIKPKYANYDFYNINKYCDMKNAINIFNKYKNNRNCFKMINRFSSIKPLYKHNIKSKIQNEKKEIKKVLKPRKLKVLPMHDVNNKNILFTMKFIVTYFLINLI